MLKDSLIFNLLLAVFATIPATGFVGFLAAYCNYYVPRPLRVDIVSISGEPMSGAPRELWESCNPKERLILIMWQLTMHCGRSGCNAQIRKKICLISLPCEGVW